VSGVTINDRAPEIALRCARLSVVIPALDEAALIGPVIDRARAAPWCEVIVVDGGSHDTTAALAAQHGARVITAPPGRGRQMNAGAAVAGGAALLFLHADTLLPAGFDVHVEEALSRPGVVAGAFTLRIDSPRRALRLIERGVDLRARRLHLPYGDQAIFLRAATFHDAGGFADVPLMEDYDLMRRLRRRGRIEVDGAAVLTSARRWERQGVFRTTLRNQLCIAAWHLGVSPARLAAWRAGGRRQGEMGVTGRARPRETLPAPRGG
jgi:rSAM/selenodomain-associated transferase 2